MAKDIPKKKYRDAICQYEQSHETKDVFSRENKALIFGKAETELKWHHSVKGENFYSVTLEVQQSEQQANHISVLISEKLMKKKNLTALSIGTWIEVAGQFRSYDLIIDGSRQTPLFILAKSISIFTRQSRIDKRIGKNAVFLDGYVTDYPILHFVCNDRKTTEMILKVPRWNNVELIPCVLRGKYAQLATKLKGGDDITFYGYIQNKKCSHNHYPPASMRDYSTAYEVVVMDILRSSMFRH